MKNKPSLLAIAALCALSFAGCNNTLRQDMANQPRQNPLSPSDFFADGRSERPVVENTVVRGSIQDDSLLVPKESNAFPLPLTVELLQRGEQRYGIYCTPCHGIQGDGMGMVAMRGMKHPPSYHEERLRNVPNRLFVRRDHQRVRRDVRLFGADFAAGPLGNCGIPASAAVEQECAGGGSYRQNYGRN